MKRIPKALVVEDTKEWQENFAEILTSIGYKVKTAGTYAEASQIVHRQSFDLAILDIRLSEGDFSNTEGMEILREIRATKEPVDVMIVSGYPTFKLTRDAFKEYHVFDFVEKDRFDEDAFIAFAKGSAERAEESGYGVKSLTKALLTETGVSYDELRSIRGSDQDIEGLLKLVFRDLWPLEKDSLSPSKLISISKGKYIIQILGWSKGIGDAVAVRIGSEHIIVSESQNYAKHKLWHLIKSYKQKSETKKNSLGAVAYILKDAQPELLRDFLTFYEDEDVSRVIDVLSKIFWHSCTKLYIERGIDKVKINLATAYKSVIDGVIADREEIFNKDKSKLSVEDTDGLIFSQREYAPVEFIRKQSFIFESPVGVVHGDLRGENIIVDSHAEAWLLGFYETDFSDVLVTNSDSSDSVVFRAHQIGKRNLLHDFATLEVSIRKTLINVYPERLKVFDLALCKSKHLGELSELTFGIPQLDKAYKVITKLRELALEILAEFEINIQLYYSELLFQFLKIYLYTPDEATKKHIWATVISLTEEMNR